MSKPAHAAVAVSPHPTGAELLRARNVGRHYHMGPSTLKVLDGCDLSVRAGEFLAIMGKSGSGKSTLLHVLGALDVPDTGEVTFDGQPVSSAGDGSRGWIDTVYAAIH